MVQVVVCGAGVISNHIFQLSSKSTSVNMYVKRQRSDGYQRTEYRYLMRVSMFDNKALFSSPTYKEPGYEANVTPTKCLLIDEYVHYWRASAASVTISGQNNGNRIYIYIEGKTF